MELNADVVVLQNPDVIARQFDDLAFVMHPERRELHHLNHTSWFVWGSIDGKRTAEDLAAAVSREYDVDIAESRRDVLELLRLLLDKDLVRVVKGGLQAS